MTRCNAEWPFEKSGCDRAPEIAPLFLFFFSLKKGQADNSHLSIRVGQRWMEKGFIHKGGEGGLDGWALGLFRAGTSAR